MQSNKVSICGADDAIGCIREGAQLGRLEKSFARMNAVRSRQAWLEASSPRLCLAVGLAVGVVLTAALLTVA